MSGKKRRRIRIWVFLLFVALIIITGVVTYREIPKVKSQYSLLMMVGEVNEAEGYINEISDNGPLVQQIASLNSTSSKDLVVACNTLALNIDNLYQNYLIEGLYSPNDIGFMFLQILRNLSFNLNKMSVSLQNLSMNNNVNSSQVNLEEALTGIHSVDLKFNNFVHDVEEKYRYKLPEITWLKNPIFSPVDQSTWINSVSSQLLASWSPSLELLDVSLAPIPFEIINGVDQLGLTKSIQIALVIRTQDVLPNAKVVTSVYLTSVSGTQLSTAQVSKNNNYGSVLIENITLHFSATGTMDLTITASCASMNLTTSRVINLNVSQS